MRRVWVMSWLIVSDATPTPLRDYMPRPIASHSSIVYIPSACHLVKDVLGLSRLHCITVPPFKVKQHPVGLSLAKHAQRPFQIRWRLVHRTIYWQPANDVSGLRLADSPSPDPLPPPVILPPPALNRPVSGKIWQILQIEPVVQRPKPPLNVRRRLGVAGSVIKYNAH